MVIRFTSIHAASMPPDANNLPAGEFAFIDWVRARAAMTDRLSVPIGDDAACWEFPEPSRCLVTTDMLMEGTHFTFPEATPQQVGRKALAVNLSDIAAMAGRPLAAFISVAFPKTHGSQPVGLGSQPVGLLTTGLYEGMLPLAEEFDTVIAGGDTNAWNGPLVVSLTLLGEVVGNGPVTRSGAQPGDGIFVTGRLGGSLADGSHFHFQPRVEEALRLNETASLHALIDLSDGLASDLLHILEESGVGAEIEADAILISDAANTLTDGQTPLQHALSDGEDFELCFTVSPSDAERLLNDPPIAVPLTRIGTIVAGRGCELVNADGSRTPLTRSGWEHVW